MKVGFCVFVSGLLLMPSLAFAAEVVSKAYSIGDIRHIEAGNAVEIELRQGDSPSLVAEAAADVLERLIVDIDGSRLRLGVRGTSQGFWGWFKNEEDDVKFVLQVPQPRGMVLHGASKARVSDLDVPEFSLGVSGASRAYFGTLAVDMLDVTLSGASYAAIQDVQAKQAVVEASGASKMEMTGAGRVRQLEVHVSGASRYSGPEVEVDMADAEASGASHVELMVVTSLNANASGASSITYFGNPQVQQEASGASRIRAAKM